MPERYMVYYKNCLNKYRRTNNIFINNKHITNTLNKVSFVSYNTAELRTMVGSAFKKKPNLVIIVTRWYYNLFHLILSFNGYMWTRNMGWKIYLNKGELEFFNKKVLNFIIKFLFQFLLSSGADTTSVPSITK